MRSIHTSLQRVDIHHSVTELVNASSRHSYQPVSPSAPPSHTFTLRFALAVLGGLLSLRTASFLNAIDDREESLLIRIHALLVESFFFTTSSSFPSYQGDT